jgi:hypothetical protein
MLSPEEEERRGTLFGEILPSDFSTLMRTSKVQTQECLQSSGSMSSQQSTRSSKPEMSEEKPPCSNPTQGGQDS